MCRSLTGRARSPCALNARSRKARTFMAAIATKDLAATQSTAIRLLPIMANVLIAFMVIGMALPVLPLHVHDDLKFWTLIVGLVAESQFAAALVSRVWAGRTCDRQGAKRAVLIGLFAAAVAGLLYLLSLGVSAMSGRSRPTPRRCCLERRPSSICAFAPSRPSPPRVRSEFGR